MKLMVIAAISREESSTSILAAKVVALCEEHGAEVTKVTPTDLALPVNDGTIPPDLAEAKAWRDMVADQDAFIWISPEYHSSMTGGLKNLLDHLGREPMRGRVVGLCAIGGGTMGALNTLNNMSIVARSLGAWVNPSHCAFSSAEIKAGLDERAERRLASMCVTVIDAAHRLTSPWPLGADREDRED